MLAHGPSLGRKRLEDVRYGPSRTAHTAVHNLMRYDQQINSVPAGVAFSAISVAKLQQTHDLEMERREQYQPYHRYSAARKVQSSFQGRRGLYRNREMLTSRG